MSILSGFLKTVKYRLTDSGYLWQSEKTSSSSVIMGDGTDDTDTLESRFGNAKGISSDTSTNLGDEYLLSQSAGYELKRLSSLAYNEARKSLVYEDFNLEASCYATYDSSDYPKTIINTFDFSNACYLVNIKLWFKPTESGLIKFGLFDNLNNDYGITCIHVEPDSHNHPQVLSMLCYISNKQASLRIGTSMNEKMYVKYWIKAIKRYDWDTE